jgi:Family of unknown function (DUF6338)
MDLAPAAYFLIPGAFAVTAHRFASAQSMSTGAQVAWAAIYSTIIYIVLQTPLGDWFTTADFPSALFGQNAALIASPSVALRFAALSLAAGIMGLGGGRLVATSLAHRFVASMTGRNLHATVWVEMFRNAPRQWVRLTNSNLDLIGWLESASDGPTERSLILSSVFQETRTGRRSIPAHLMLVDASRFDTIILLGKDVSATYAAAASRASSSRPSS